MNVKNTILQLLLITGLMACSNSSKEKYSLQLSLASAQADQLSNLPLQCIQQEFPNKLGQVLVDTTDIKRPKRLHPAFYGCFDWHSAVHGHWSLVKLCKQFPELEYRDSIIQLLHNNLSEANIQAEIDYFNQPQNYSYERTYGWAWLLMLATELKTWDNPNGKTLYENLQPLAALIANNYVEFLPKLNYPVRVGTHTNTAFGMSFAYDYAILMGDSNLQKTIKTEGKRLFMQDKSCPIYWEPSGTDFLSPCLEEARLMCKILPPDEFLYWMQSFLPQLSNPSFDLEVGKVSDREDGHLVHLDGLNFSRAWCLKTLSQSYPKAYGHLADLANQHITYSLPHLVGDAYEGGHWLASFAIYSMSE